MKCVCINGKTLNLIMSSRIVSLDQFRGYTVAAMFFVNFLGGYACMHPVFTHHGNYCSFADLVMPHFFFAVGFSFRYTFPRSIEKLGAWPAYRKAIKRNLGLILLGAIYYGLDGSYGSWSQIQSLGVWGFLQSTFRSAMFEALTHIGLTGLWLLPVILTTTRGLWAFMFFTGSLHVGLSHLFYYDWGMRHGMIDGGQLGFMSWAIPTLAGAIACDWMRDRGPRRALAPLIGWGVLLSLLGYGLSCLNNVHHALIGNNPLQGAWRWLAALPFTPPALPQDMWTMSQTACSVSYTTYGAGISLLLYALFVVACDMSPLRLGVFRTFGTNALAAYLIHSTVQNAVAPLTPGDSPMWYAFLAFAVFFGVTYLFVRYLEKNNIHIRL